MTGDSTGTAEDGFEVLRDREYAAESAERKADEEYANAVARLLRAGKAMAGDIESTVLQEVQRVRDSIQQAWTGIKDFLSEDLTSALRRGLRLASETHWLATALLVLFAVLNDHLYYRRFDFDVSGYYSGWSVSGFLVLCLGGLLLVVCVVCLSVFLLFVLVYLAPLILLLAVASFRWALVGTVGRSAVWTFRFCCTSTGFIQLTLSLTRALDAQPRIAYPYTLVARMDGMIDSITADVKVRGATLRRVFVWVGCVVVAASLAYGLAIEPQYRAELVCRDEHRTRAVVVPSRREDAEQPLRIGSNGGYVFVVSEDWCAEEGETPSGEGDEGGEQGQARRENISGRWHMALPTSLSNRLSFMEEESGTGALGFARFVLNLTPVERSGAVVALPISPRRKAFPQPDTVSVARI